MKNVASVCSLLFFLFLLLLSSRSISSSSDDGAGQSFSSTFRSTSSDKVRHHGYETVYEEFLSPLRYGPITLLEIGVEDGHSMIGWTRYLSHKHARIVGVKHNANVKETFSDPRISIVEADQSKEKDLLSLASREGPFDVIIDDGSHVPSHQLLTFRILWPHVKQGGLYAIEDVETSYWRKGSSIYGYQVNGSFVDQMTSLIRTEVNSEFSSGRDDTSVQDILFARNMIVVRKRGKTYPFHRKRYRFYKHLERKKFERLVGA